MAAKKPDYTACGSSSHRPKRAAALKFLASRQEQERHEAEVEARGSKRRPEKDLPKEIFEPPWEGFPDAPDPLGEVQFDLLQDSSPHSILCDACNVELKVHPEVITAYEKPQRVRFICRFLTGKPCPGETEADRLYPWRGQRGRLGVAKKAKRRKRS
mmetsp:Transcript_4915/g.8760  ORF Transcript_4915/g.8760 Transcript_4915/m.8760 type:complete len:157 (-) Transcript_4915:16-486(-)